MMPFSWLKPAVVLPFLAFACAAATAKPVPPRTYRIALLQERSGAPGSTLAGRLTARLRQSGFIVTPLSFEQVADPAVFNAKAFDCLLLPDAPRFAGSAKDNLMAFVKTGGDLALLGGHAFSEPVCRAGNRWVTQAAWNEMLRAVPLGQRLLNLDAGSLSAWKRGTNKPEHASRLSAEQANGVPAMRVDIRDIGQWQWDTFAAQLPDGFPASDGLFCFRAKGDAKTPQVALEIDERDGSRWVATIDLTSSWQRYVLSPNSFRFLSDSSPKGRGGTGDHLKLADAARVSFGMATGLTRYADGDHTLWISEIGSARLDTPLVGDFSQRVELPVFSDYEAYAMRGARRAEAYTGQDILPKTDSVDGACDGLSAIGFTLDGKSRFTPLLAAEDRYGRRMGWALGLVVNFGGPYKGSNWLLCGVTSPAFYASKGLDAIVDALYAMRDRDLAAQAEAANRREQAAVIKLTAPAPKGFIRRSADGRHFLLPDGKPFFMVGTNYLGVTQRFCQLSIAGLDDDFRRAHEAGINVFRLWVGCNETDPARRNALIQCARKYGIYLLLHIADYERNGDAVVSKARAIAEAWKDEPMVLGYDLANEPYLGVIGGIRFGGEESPILRLKPYERFNGQYDRAWVDNAVKTRPAWPQIASWAGEDEARELYAATNLWERYTNPYLGGGSDYSTLTGITRQLPMQGDLKELAEAVNATFGRWIEAQKDAIRSVDQHHFITVGYNTVLSSLPANRALDFVSQHVYQAPNSLSEALKNVTTLERLAKAWPDQPITLGEFGYTNGLMIGGEPLDFHTSAVGETMIWLQTLADGNDGCLKWMLNDVPVEVMRDNVPWIGPDKQVYEAGFGIYAYDGTPEGLAKPIAHAMRFLREYVDAGGRGGKMEVREGATRIGAVYTYRAPDALFVGDASRTLPGLSFKTANGLPADVMLRWNVKELRLMSDADATIRLDPSVFAPALKGGKVSVTGRLGALRQDGKQLVIQALEGEELVLR